MTPSLKSVPSIPYISRNPAISFPILLIWLVVTYFLARNYLSGTPSNRDAEGLKLGLVFAALNFALDLLVLVFLLKTGIGYFASATVWLAYLLLLLIPWLTGRSLQKALP
ncbi:MAG TPA: hypothetical protein VIU65_06520 [Pyrinomonadaceae bacterium]